MTANECISASISQRVSVMNFRVLLANSDVEMLDIYGRYFERCWYEVDTVASGVECVAALRKLQPHALVVHRNLLWGGFEGVMERIHCDREMPFVPIVAIEEHEADPRPHYAQIVATLTTPFRMVDLDRLLRWIFTSSVVASAQRTSIEAMSGLDFFDELDNEVEETSNWNTWQDLNRQPPTRFG